METRGTPWMTPEEARAYLGGISERTLTRYRADGLPVHYLTPRTPRYHQTEVDEWVRAGGTETPEAT